VRASVVVSTRNRAELLEGSLRSILADGPTPDWELVVVDNGSTDGTAALVERLSREAGGDRIRYVREERPGLSNARNAGIAAAAGDLLLFTDDDVLVEPGWLDALCAGFADDDVAAVAGRVVPEWPHPPPRWLAGRHAGVLALTDFGDEPRDLTAAEYPLGANMAVRASVVGPAPFDPRLGHRGGTYFAFEEFALFHELRAAGGRFTYRPDAVVRHRILAERMTWEGMRRATLHNGFGSRRAERFRGEPGVARHRALPYLARNAAATLRHARRNRSRADLPPEAAFEELSSWWALGRWIYEALGERAGAAAVRRLA
jgi:glycosyltransferase involved in cell wall biosynthesis